jgi:hypothetical protein
LTKLLDLAGWGLNDDKNDDKQMIGIQAWREAKMHHPRLEEIEKEMDRLLEDEAVTMGTIKVLKQAKAAIGKKK